MYLKSTCLLAPEPKDSLTSRGFLGSGSLIGRYYIPGFSNPGYEETTLLPPPVLLLALRGNESSVNFVPIPDPVHGGRGTFLGSLGQETQGLQVCRVQCGLPAARWLVLDHCLLRLQGENSQTRKACWSALCLSLLLLT